MPVDFPGRLRVSEPEHLGRVAIGFVAGPDYDAEHDDVHAEKEDGEVVEEGGWVLAVRWLISGGLGPKEVKGVRNVQNCSDMVDGDMVRVILWLMVAMRSRVCMK